MVIGGLVLFSFILGRALIRLNVRFVIGIFLFLTGVSGIIVAFLYVVALCPNPVLKGFPSGASLFYSISMWVFAGVFIPLIIIFSEFEGRYGIEIESIREIVEWFRDPCIFRGLSNLIPLLGVLLFLCIVRVVSLCMRQKQCLGGQGSSNISGGANISVKRLYR